MAANRQVDSAMLDVIVLSSLFSLADV